MRMGQAPPLLTRLQMGSPLMLETARQRQQRKQKITQLLLLIQLMLCHGVDVGLKLQSNNSSSRTIFGWHTIPPLLILLENA